MKFTKNIMALCLVAVLVACSHKTADKLVGNDSDEHGCIASAGYRWSEALKDCVRIWEVGERADSGDKKVFVVFSHDMSVAEVYADSGERITCRRHADSNTWKSKKRGVSLSKKEGIITVMLDGDKYTTPYK